MARARAFRVPGPRHLSESLLRVTCLSRCSESLVSWVTAPAAPLRPRIAPRRRSESSIRVVAPSRRSESPFRAAAPSPARAAAGCPTSSSTSWPASFDPAPGPGRPQPRVQCRRPGRAAAGGGSTGPGSDAAGGRRGGCGLGSNAVPPPTMQQVSAQLGSSTRRYGPGARAWSESAPLGRLVTGPAGGGTRPRRR